MPRVLITGGAGFIGSHLVMALAERGDDVLVIDRTKKSEAKGLVGFAGEYRSRELGALPLEIEGPLAAVFHQAAITDPRHSDDAKTESENWEGFRQIWDLCRKKSAKLVYASTAGLYGNGPVPMQEGQDTQILTAYGRSKLRIENWVSENHSEVQAVGLRYFNVFGPHEAEKGRPASMIYHLSQQMRGGGKRPRIFFDGHQRRDHIYVKDVVTANLLALAAPSGVYNVGTGRGTSFNELVEILNEFLGVDFSPEYIEMPFERATYQHHTVADTVRAEKVLGFRAEWVLREAIRDYLSEYRENT